MSSDTHSAFELLHRSVQLQLRRMKWDYLRPLQVETIHAVLQSEKNVIVSAATASGKTEAAFLPVLSKIADEPFGSIRALYVGPLKALINDQFSRVEDLCHYLEMPVHRWHGDVAATSKKKLVQKPGGVLLLTPESLESLFVNRSEHLGALFHGLRFVVIDELHAFVASERGLHLQSLLSRMSEVVPHAEPFRIIGLSATLGDALPAQKMISAQHPADVTVIEDNTPKELRLQIHGYLETAGDDTEGFVELQIAKDIVRHCAGHTNLVFTNRRTDVEVYADRCNELAKAQRSDERFLVHHGSLARDIREDTEETLKSTRRVTAFCSSTLELGIDIGNVRMVGQIGEPNSVSSLKQRVGRSGRRDDEARLLRMYISSDETDAKSDVFDRLHLSLIQSIAVTQLMLSGWIESSRPATCDLSTLTHQIISVISQTGGMAADKLHERLCLRGAFFLIEPALFGRLLRRLGEKEVDVIEQTPTGEIILGMRGERLRAARDYYPVFPTPQEFSVLHQGRALGSLPVLSPSEVDEHLIFAGRRWLVIAVDAEKREIHVVAAGGRKRPKFAGSGGEICNEVRAMMRRVLLGQEQYLYLDAKATELLQQARAAAVASDICGVPLFVLGEKRTAIMTWCGCRVLETLKAMLALSGVEVEVSKKTKAIALIGSTSVSRTRNVLAEVIAQNFEPLELAQKIPGKTVRKYDFLFDDELLEIGIARDRLDIEGAMQVMKRLEAEWKVE